MSKLKSVYIDRSGDWVRSGNDTGKFYLKSEVDALLSEKDKEIESLKKKCEAEKSIGATFSKNGAELARWVEELREEIETLKASHYAEMVDAGMRERRLKRAFYKVCAKWAFLAQWERGELVENWEKWEKFERKCGAKAKEYK